MHIPLILLYEPVLRFCNDTKNRNCSICLNFYKHHHAHNTHDDVLEKDPKWNLVHLIIIWVVHTCKQKCVNTKKAISPSKLEWMVIAAAGSLNNF